MRQWNRECSWPAMICPTTAIGSPGLSRTTLSYLHVDNDNGSTRQINCARKGLHFDFSQRHLGESLDRYDKQCPMFGHRRLKVEGVSHQKKFSAKGRSKKPDSCRVMQLFTFATTGYGMYHHTSHSEPPSEARQSARPLP